MSCSVTSLLVGPPLDLLRLGPAPYQKESRSPCPVTSWQFCVAKA
jgi:hypothetical protein